MKFLPVSLNIGNKKILLIGGGKVAYHKAKLILPFTSTIHIVAREVCDELKSLRLPYLEKDYEKDDLTGFFLVYACTDIRELNQQIYNDAHLKGILVNVVDNPPLCDFVSPAIYRKENMTVAVGSNAEDVMKSIAWRDKIKEYFEHDLT